jgi:SAM-dependent methyltransferase
MGGSIEKKFGYEWDLYREIIPLHEQQFVEWIQPVPLALFRDKTFLDAGCGIGRNSLWALRAGAAAGHAFDYDERTTRIARENLKSFPNCTIGYQSIYDLAFREAFDVVFCIGVLHHLREPERAVKRLVEAVKPGGTLILWVYAREGNERYLRIADPVRRAITSRLPLPLTRAVATALTACLKLYLVPQHRDPYLSRLKQRSFRHLEAMVFDQLIPPVSHYWTREEALALLDRQPVDIVCVTHTNGISWTIVAKKRAGV